MRRPKLTPEQKESFARAAKEVAEDEKIHVISQCYVCGERRYTKADVGTHCYAYNGANGTYSPTEPCGGHFVEIKFK